MVDMAAALRPLAAHRFARPITRLHLSRFLIVSHRTRGIDATIYSCDVIARRLQAWCSLPCSLQHAVSAANHTTANLHCTVLIVNLQHIDAIHLEARALDLLPHNIINWMQVCCISKHFPATAPGHHVSTVDKSIIKVTRRCSQLQSADVVGVSAEDLQTAMHSRFPRIYLLVLGPQHATQPAERAAPAIHRHWLPLGMGSSSALPVMRNSLEHCHRTYLHIKTSEQFCWHADHHHRPLQNRSSRPCKQGALQMVVVSGCAGCKATTLRAPAGPHVVHASDLGEAEPSIHLVLACLHTRLMEAPLRSVG